MSYHSNCHFIAFLIFSSIFLSSIVRADEVGFETKLSGEKLIPPVDSSAKGSAEFEYDENELEYEIELHGLKGKDVTAVHIHGPATDSENAPIIFVLSNSSTELKGSVQLNKQQSGYLTSGLLYLKIHTTQNPTGELRGQIRTTATYFIANMEGRQVVPRIDTPATGSASIKLNYDSLNIKIKVEHDVNDVTSIQLRGPAAFGNNANLLFSLSSTDSDFSEEIQLTDQQTNYLRDGLIYITIQSSAHPNGEIRGQFVINMDDPNGDDMLEVVAVTSGALLIVILLILVSLMIAAAALYYYRKDHLSDYLKKRSQRRFSNSDMNNESLLSDYSE